MAIHAACQRCRIQDEAAAVCTAEAREGGEGGQRILRAAVITVKLQNTHHGHSTVGVTTL